MRVEVLRKKTRKHDQPVRQPFAALAHRLASLPGWVVRRARAGLFASEGKPNKTLAFALIGW
jgi:hypothetical protein